MKRQPTTQQITWFIDLYKSDQIELNPPYQRRSVWSLKDRKFFLDTIFRNYPAPPIFIHREVDDYGKTTYNIVDGKQRLETIFMFIDNKISIDSGFGDVNLNGKKFKDLDTEYKRLFWDYTLIADFIEISKSNSIEDVFDRVNRNSRNLQPQELRHARFSGWFINFIESEVQDDFWIKYKITTKARDKRMRNAQFLSELSMIQLSRKIIGFDQFSIDQFYAEYDDILEKSEAGDFIEDDFREELKELKRTVIDITDKQPDLISVLEGSNNNFYTLWAYLVYKNNKISEDFPNKYLTLLNRVKTIKEETNIEVDDTVGHLAKKYADNSTGAATDLPQRQARLDVLLSL